MPLAVAVNGTLQYGSGAYSTYTVVPTSGVDPASIGIVQLIGEADGGAPGYTLITNPRQAKTVFRGGPLANAIIAAFNPAAGEDDIPGGAFKVPCYKTNQGTAASTTLYQTNGTDHVTTAGSTATVIAYPATPFTASAQIGRWLKIGTERRRITANTTSTLTVSPGFSTAPATGITTTILNNALTATAKDYGTHTNGVSIEFEAAATAGQYTSTIAFEDRVETVTPVGLTPYVRLVYVAGPVPAAGAGSATGTIGTIGTSTTISVTLGGTPTLDQYALMVLELPGNVRRRIVGNTAASPSVFTIETVHALTAAQMTSFVGGTATVRNITSATASTTGANGVAVSLTSTVAPTADNLSIVFTAGLPLRQLIDYINANTNYRATAGSGINVDTALPTNFDFGTMNTTVDVRFDSAVEDALLSGDTAPTKRTRLYQDLFEFISVVNAGSQLVTLTRSTVGAGEGAMLPDVTGGAAGTSRDVPIFLTGGLRGTSSNTNWQAGFDAFELRRGTSICPLAVRDLSAEGNNSTATYASIVAMLQLHIDRRNTSLRNECGGYIGLKGTFTALRAQARAFNSPHIHISGQSGPMLDVAGNITAMDEWLPAVIAAGMRSGGKEIGTPLTRKALRMSSLTTDSSWDPHSTDILNLALADGILVVQDRARFGETGIRFNRDRTTYVANSAQDIYNDGNMSEELRFLVYDFRQRLELVFLGKKNHSGGVGAPATTTAIKDESNAILESYVKEPYRILTYSNDPDKPGSVVPGFDRVAVRSEGNATRITARVFFTPDTAFLLPEITAAIPSMSA